jgi:hypothetical protein
MGFMSGMKGRMRPPSAGLVVGFVALGVALGGTATALDGTDTVEQNDLQDNSVGRPQIKSNAVRRGEINDGAVQNAELGTIVSREDINQLSDGASGYAEAECEPGERLIGGGGEFQQYATDGIYGGDRPSTGGANRPTNGGEFDAWSAKGTNAVGGNATLDVRAYALCLQ